MNGLTQHLSAFLLSYFISSWVFLFLKLNYTTGIAIHVIQRQPRQLSTNNAAISTGKGEWEIAGLKCGAITFRVSLQCRGNDGVLTLGSLPQGDFWGKEQSFDFQFAPWGWGLQHATES